MEKLRQLFSKLAWAFQNGRKVFTLVVILLILVFVMSSMKWTCGCKPPLPPANITVEPDPTKPTVTKPTSYTYTPKPTAGNPKPTPVTVPKPVEGNVTVIGETVKVQQLGFCLIPKAGYSTEGLYGGARVFFWGKFGMELMANERCGFLGVDYRLPFLNQITVAAGGRAEYKVPVTFGPYAGASICLAQF